MRRGGLWVMALLGLTACTAETDHSALPAEVTAVERVTRRRVSGRGEAAASKGAAPAAVVEPAATPVVVERLRAVGVDQLVTMLATTTGRHRRDVVYELVGRSPPESAFEPLIDLLMEADAGTAAAHALACFGERASRTVRARADELRASGDDSDRLHDLEYGYLEIVGLFPHLEVREASCAPAPPPPTLATLRRWLSDESPQERRDGAVAAGARGEKARELVPEIAAALARDDAVDIHVIAEAMRDLGAEHEALLVVRARMARADRDGLRACMQALGELGEIARDDVTNHAPRVLAVGGEFGRVAAFDALRATGADPAPFREAVAESLREFAYDRSAAAALVRAHPNLALEMRDDLVRALPEGEFSGGRRVVAAIRVTGGLPAADALRLLDTVESCRVSRILAAVGPDTTRPGDDVALRLWEIVLADESDSHAEDALEALERAGAIDGRDIPRLLDAVESRGLGVWTLAELCRNSSAALPRLLYLLERGHDVAWPLAMLGPRAEAALPRLVLEARDQDSTAANAVGSIGAAGVEPLRMVLDGQHDVLREAVLLDVLAGVHETADDRTAAQVDSACRGYLALLVDVPSVQLDSHLSALSVHDDSHVRWAADRLR